ncbi:MAG: TIGR03564 family F420-dependent LLM class oxidoreductase [Alphaproteobacteria bacterium]|jgi:5,10-methylenetetrahydromethanopterin reductase|nr:TIGR03564 family F420-dependent LLM class oxidoreductase [Alphaproteobacteria bacterium]
MSNDRFGMRWGYAGGTTLASIEEARAAGQFAAAAGFDSFWISHAKGVDPMMALACIADDVADLQEVGTSVTPLYGRHPIGLSQLVRTAQNALDGRFTLGVGASAKGHAEGTLGLSWDKPFSYTREFFDAMEPLLAGQPADVTGDQVSAHGELNIASKPTPILLAALGPRMLKFAGARAAGTTLGQCGPKTIASYVKPLLEAGAEAAGRSAPRIMALVRICVTEDREAAKAVAREISSFYQEIPSYSAVIAKEGLAEPADLHLIGSWQEILDNLAAYAEAGATDFRIQAAAHDAKSQDATNQALADYLS